MKLESIYVENYRQFEEAEITFDGGTTILAGANNSGKTSLINLVKNLFVDEKTEYNVADIPAKNIQEWVDWVYPIFEEFVKSENAVEAVEEKLINAIIPKDETLPKHLMKTTIVTGATVGKSFLIDQLPYESVYASFLIRIRLIKFISSQYIYNFFNSPYYWEQISNKSVGVGQPNCNGTSLSNLFIPIPPAKTQNEIVSLITKLFEYIEEIEKSLS